MALSLPLLATAGENEGITVLMYHRVMDSPTTQFPLGETVVTTDEFQEHVNWLASNGYKTITLAQLAKLMTGTRPLPPKTVVITFDDGWADQLSVVRMLKRHKFTATFAIISNTPDRNPVYMSWFSIKQLADSGFEIATHTHTHTNKMDENQAEIEIIASKYLIESKTGKPVESLVLPYGYFNNAVNPTAKSVGISAVATVGATWCTDTENPVKADWRECLSGYAKNNIGQDTFRIRRVVVDGRCPLETFSQSVVSGNIMDDTCPARQSADNAQTSDAH